MKKILCLFIMTICVFNAKGQCDSNGSIVISEIYFDTHYNEVIDSKFHHFGEFIELFNSSNVPIDLNGWKLKDNHTEFTIHTNNVNPNTIIQPGGIKIITFRGFYAYRYRFANGKVVTSGSESDIGARNKFAELFPQAATLKEDIILQDRIVLYNNVDKISILSPSGRLIDEISYKNYGGYNGLSDQAMLDFMHVNSFTVQLENLDNTYGGAFNGPIGYINVLDENGNIAYDENGNPRFFQSTRYLNSIFLSNADDYYYGQNRQMSVGLATPFSIPFTIQLSNISEMLDDPTSLSNWTESIGYDLLGNRIAHSKFFFNGLGKPTVSMTKDFENNLVWGTEDEYDSFGRALRKSFPAPVCYQFEKTNFLTNPYHFVNTLSKYYSNDNGLELYQATATHPFSEINYDKLNPGNIINVVGGNKINNEWKTGSSFTVNAGQEMYYVYGHAYFDGPIIDGKEEITAKFYKNISIDADGKEVTTFFNAEGKILASAKSGGYNAGFPVYSLIGVQGFVDVYAPPGSVFSFIGPSADYKIYDLLSGQEVPISSLRGGNPFRIQSLIPIQTDPTVFVDHAGGALSYSAGVQGVSYTVQYYDFAINVYNKSGQVTKVVQPNGYVHNSTIEALPSFIDDSATNFINSVSYNTLGQVVESKSADEGVSTIAYREDGQIRYSQNAVQVQNGQISYSEYDDLGRPIESGVVLGNWNIISQNPDASLQANAARSEQTFIIYDFVENNLTSVAIPQNLTLGLLLSNAGILNTAYQQKNLSANVAITFSKFENSINAITWYSYDIYGRLDWIVQYNEGNGVKTIHYEYDKNGNIKKNIFQKDSANEMFVHLYDYDINGKLTGVKTSKDNINFNTEADYAYYLSGELKRTNMANGIQGIDYVYTLGGQLKSINHPSLEKLKDPGRDSNDVFGIILDYYDGDYNRANSNITSSSHLNIYSGNIKSARWSNVSMDLSLGAIQQKVYAYSYNDQGFLANAKFGHADNSGTILSSLESQARILGKYYEGGISYDANGNILTLRRTNGAVDGIIVDDFSYTYKDGTNQLDHITDYVSALTTTPSSNDIESQPAGNYLYDALGRLATNVSEGLTYVYNAGGLVVKILNRQNNPIVKFYYNERGNRIIKESFSSSGAVAYTEHYSMDLQGNVMAVYRKSATSGIVQKELPIYGIDRLGVYYRSDDSRNYEITDHLGNVRAVLKKLPGSSGSVMASFADYYPFGEKLPERNSNSGNYRYAFQGQELDPETGMEAFQLRLWDGRIGRWLNPDPMGQYFSPYLGMGNNPVNLTDPTGGWAQGDPPSKWSIIWNSLFGSSDDIAAHVQLEPVEIVNGGGSSFWTSLFGDTFSFSNWTKPTDQKSNQYSLLASMAETREGLEDVRTGMEMVPFVDAYFSIVADKNYTNAGLQLGANFIPIGGFSKLTKAGKVVHTPPEAINGLVDIISGNGSAIMRNGAHETVRVAQGMQRQWIGALEWRIKDVKNTSINGSRILQKINPDGSSTWGYLTNHNYKIVHEIPTTSPVPW